MQTDQRSAHRPTALVVDDCSQTRSTFQLAFPALRVIDTFPTVGECLRHGGNADVIILDLALETSVCGRQLLQGPAAIKSLVNRQLRVCVYTDECRPLILAHCLAAGATGIARKCDPLATNQAAFLAVATGQTSIAKAFTSVSHLLQRRGAPPTLTLRQLQVLNARARGEAWQELGHRLGISAKTAYDRLEAVRNKLAWHLQDIGLEPDASPADIERCLGVGPGDVMAFSDAIALPTHQL